MMGLGNLSCCSEIIGAEHRLALSGRRSTCLGLECPKSVIHNGHNASKNSHVLFIIFQLTTTLDATLLRWGLDKSDFASKQA